MAENKDQDKMEEEAESDEKNRIVLLLLPGE